MEVWGNGETASGKYGESKKEKTEKNKKDKWKRIPKMKNKIFKKNIIKYN